MRSKREKIMNNQEKHLGSVPEDIEDVLRLIEKSYDIKFEGNELGHIRTFGQLTNHIISKIKLESKCDCTDQQAFYKLRTVIETIKDHKKRIEPKAQLTDIFPRRTRRKDIKEIEKRLGLNLKALRPRHIITNSLLIILLASIVVLFIKWQFGLAGFLFSIGGLWISQRMGTEFKDRTLGELTDRMTQLNYVKSRRQSGTMNIKEIQNKIEKLFVDNLGLDEKTIDKDTVII
jgi:acyl carrier protein